MKKYVYSWGNGTADGNGSMKEVLGGKGAGLAEMAKAAVPVPPGFTISTEVCNIFFENNRSVPQEIEEQVDKGLAKLEKASAKNPAMPSTRCCSACARAQSFRCPA